MAQIANHHGRALDVLAHDGGRRPREELVDLLEGLVLGLGHEEDLVEPADGGDAAIETQGETDTGHGVHHGGEVVGDDEGAEEEVGVGSGHAVGSQVGGEDFGRDDPGETGVGAEEAHVEDDAGQIDTLGGGGVIFVVDGVAGADKDQTDEEARKHGVGPVATAELLHVHDGGDGADEQRTTADQRHENTGAFVETDLGHEDAHVVHDGIDTGELTQEDHGVGVDHGTTGTRVGEEVHPGILACVLLLLALRRDGLSHAQKFVLGVERLKATNPLPDAVGLNRFALVHEETRTFGKEQHSHEQDGREDQRGAEDVPPVAVDIDKDGGYCVAQNLTQGNVQLV